MNGIECCDAYRVNEIFYSLQGEGFYTGTAAVFLRFSGCNRRCSFCDTDHSEAHEMSLADIIQTVTSYPARHIVVTGGEPSLQLDDKLVDAFHAAGFYIQVETNGSLPLPEAVDWVTCSPKTPPLDIERIDELKLVLDGDIDPDAVADALPMATHYFLQPCSCINTGQVVEYILKHPLWRLSLQTHKLIDIR